MLRSDNQLINKIKKSSLIVEQSKVFAGYATTLHGKPIGFVPDSYELRTPKTELKTIQNWQGKDVRFSFLHHTPNYSWVLAYYLVIKFENMSVYAEVSLPFTKDYAYGWKWFVRKNQPEGLIWMYQSPLQTTPYIIRDTVDKMVDDNEKFRGTDYAPVSVLPSEEINFQDWIGVVQQWAMKSWERARIGSIKFSLIQNI